MKHVTLRIGTISLEKATYLGEEPAHPRYSISRWRPNPLYGTRGEYTQDDRGRYYKPERPGAYYDVECFEHPETSYMIADFKYDPEGYELHFIGDRPLELSSEELSDFWKIIQFGYSTLNKLNTISEF